HGRVSYRALKRQFGIDDDYLADLTEAILFAHPQVVDEGGRGLIWTENAGPLPTPPAPQPGAAVVTREPALGESNAPPLSHPSPTRNGTSSPSCFVIWSIRRCWPASLTRKTSARWCGPIKTRAPRRLPALRATSRSISAMGCWSTSAIP